MDLTAWRSLLTMAKDVTIKSGSKNLNGMDLRKIGEKLQWIWTNLGRNFAVKRNRENRVIERNVGKREETISER